MATHAFSIKEALQFGWKTFKKNWKFIILSLLMLIVARGVLSSIITSISTSLSLGGGIASIINWVLDSFVTMSAIIICLKFVDGKTPVYKDLYSHYANLPKFLLGSVLVGLIMLIPVMIIGFGNNINQPIVAFIGLLLLIFPGIYLNLKYQFTTYLIIDKNMHPLDAFKKSGQLTQGIKSKLFLLALVQFGVILLGVLALIVGVFVSIAVAYISGAYVYRKLSPKN